MNKLNRYFKVATGFIFVAILFCSELAISQDLENSLLWKVEKKRCKTSYLFGTIHMMPQSDFEMKPKVKRALSESQLLILEMDISAPGLQLEMMQYALMIDGHTIDQLLPDSTYKKVDAALQKATGMPLAMMNAMKPFIISSFLVSQFIDEEPVSFEVKLAEMAARDSIDIYGLESLQEQMAVFDSIPYQEQADELAEMIENPHEMDSLYTAMVDAYKNEELNLLGEMLAEEVTGDVQNQVLLIKRNHNWIPLIEGQMKIQRNFIAVGAAHLGGEDGLILLLREAGYNVSPVTD